MRRSACASVSKRATADGSATLSRSCRTSTAAPPHHPWYTAHARASANGAAPSCSRPGRSAPSASPSPPSRCAAHSRTCAASSAAMRAPSSAPCSALSVPASRLRMRHTLSISAESTVGCTGASPPLATSSLWCYGTSHRGVSRVCVCACVQGGAADWRSAVVVLRSTSASAGAAAAPMLSESCVSLVLVSSAVSAGGVGGVVASLILGLAAGRGMGNVQERK